MLISQECEKEYGGCLWLNPIWCESFKDQLMRIQDQHVPAWMEGKVHKVQES